MGPAHGPDGPVRPAAALKYRSASEPSRRKMRWIGGDRRSGRAPWTVARRDNRLAPARRVRALFRESGMKSTRSARAERVRLRSRCTTAAPKRVTSATERVTAQCNEAFCNGGASRVGGRNSARFLSMQRPKPVDTGPPM